MKSEHAWLSPDYFEVGHIYYLMLNSDYIHLYRFKRICIDDSDIVSHLMINCSTSDVYIQWTLVCGPLLQM